MYPFLVVDKGCMRGGGYVWRGLAPNLASLSTASFPNMPKFVHIFWCARGDVCCDSSWIMVCMSNLSGWLWWDEGWQRWL